MRKLILLLFLICFNKIAFSQVIKGTILESETNNPVCFATIYFNGTFVGTSSDENGNFELSIMKNTSMPLTISAIGYYSVTLANYSKNVQLIIYLKPKVYIIKDVVVKAKSLKRKRKRNLRLFKEEFIGTTSNAQECRILNEKDITFNYDSDDDTIKAYALKPIQIENNALGYRITYYLDKFEYYKNTDATFFCGNLIFKDDLSNDEAKRKFYYIRRENTYLGSRMHLIRVLSSGSLKKSGFTIRNTSYKRLKIKDIVYTDENNNKFLKNSGNIIIEYHSRKSGIEFFKDSIYFDKLGFFNPGLKWSGYMGQQRIADWLPYEYTIEK